VSHWLAIVGSPLVLLGAISAGYALVPWACAHQQGGVLDLVIAFALAATFLAVGLETHHLRGVQRQRESPVGARQVFLSHIGIALAVLCALALVAQWATRLAIAPCAS